MGMSPIDIAREAIAEGLSMQSYSNRFFANDAKPGGGWIEVPGKMGDRDTKQTFRDDWQQMQGGANRGKVAVLERGMKFHELGLNNEQAQFVEARAARSRRSRHLPGPAAQDHGPEPVHEQQHRAAGHRVLAGLHAAVDGAVGVLDRVLPAGPDSDLEVEFDMSRMMRGDAIARSQYASTMVNAGVMTRNECRDMEGLDPIDGLDEPLRPLNMVEESHAGDEIAEGDGAEDDKPAGATEARLQAVLKSNAARMARRLVAGKAVPTEALAEALGVDVATAATWRGGPWRHRGADPDRLADFGRENVNHHFLAFCLSTPWAMLPERMRAYEAVLLRRYAAKSGTPVAYEDREIAVEPVSAGPRGGGGRQGAIAVIPIYGAIVQRASQINICDGGTSTQQVSAALRDALADETVSQILLDIDSPGGSVFGVGELADEIRAARNASRSSPSPTAWPRPRPTGSAARPASST
jgi:hypothetical protein